MPEKEIEIDFGALGIGIFHSPDGKITLPIEIIARVLALPESAKRALIEKRISLLEEEEKLAFQHRLLGKARAMYQESLRRGRR